MLGRAATRIELNRDSDMDELEQEKNRRVHEYERQMHSHQAPFGQRMGPSRINQSHYVRSIFTNDSSSSGLGGQSMLQMPNFQPHNLGGPEQNFMQAAHHISDIGSGTAHGQQNDGHGSLMVYGMGPVGAHGQQSSHTPAARPQQLHHQQVPAGHQTQTHASQQNNMNGQPDFYPHQPNQEGEDMD